MEYSDDEVALLKEEDLFIRYWDEQAGKWINAAKTCTPPSTYTRNLDENWLEVNICHLSDYGLFGDYQNRSYLPVLH